MGGYAPYFVKGVKDLSKKEVICIRQTVPAGGNVTISERVKSPGTVEEVRVRFYAGHERELRVIPYILHKGQKREDMVTFPEGTDQFLSGDDDYLILPVVLESDYDDEIKVYAENINADFDYSLVVDIVIDYYGGKNRVTGGVVSG